MGRWFKSLLLTAVVFSCLPNPNVIIINGGTNDAIQNIAPSEAGDRMNNILNDIWGAEGMSGACIMLSTVLDTTHSTGRVTRITINGKYRKLVKQRAGDGKCTYIADMDPPGTGGWISWDDYDPAETTKIHPNDEGHRKMAYVFYKAINTAATDNKLVESAGDFEIADPVCDKVFGNGIGAGGKTQRGSGEHDGIYLHEAQEKGIILTVESDWDRNQWRFAKLFYRDYDDFVGWFEKSKNEHAFGVWLENSADGQGAYTKIADMYPNMYCIPRGIHFIGMNADGLDDVVCIGPEGNLYLSINQGDGDRVAGKPPTFKFLDKIKENEGYAQDRVGLADIDGDGRSDYGILDDGGNVHFWRNGWVNDKPEYWQSLGLRGVRFEDINGDGRDDWLWVDIDRMTTTWTNSRSCKPGKLGDGLNAFGNLGRKDYVFLQHDKHNGKHRFRMRTWKNVGQGGTKVVAGGNKYCNMVGHNDGKEDYVNRGKTTISDSDPDMHRRDLHLADWDDDGDCDIIYVNPDNGAVEVFINEYPQRKKWEWTHLSNPAPARHCNQKRGLGIDDLAVRFADLTGNHRADYMCIEKDGRVTGFVHKDDGGWEDVGQFKFADGKDRANLRWADVNSDVSYIQGRDDMLWVDKFTGNGHVWYNGDRGDPNELSGSSFHWGKINDPVYRGDVAGTCEFYPDLDGNG
ncbi:family 3 carbohydrate esterase [Dactylonectria estremocensis]|uniref:Family 3 carbohydrate esterase n=1 Tax=Dactylonectria estremocensis TaxID=1079267 RepID=A0A9P9E2F2_9HYPO|nr:family 3 carbohydrate esterase [Dactylonectria estremocensis]